MKHMSPSLIAVMVMLPVMMISTETVHAANQICILPNATYSVCNFYPTCLESAIPCGKSGYSFAYGEKYCKAYDVTYHRFTSSGQVWIDQVRRCLQFFLVPYLTKTPPPTCQQLKQDAFNSHLSCYTQGTRGFCELGLWDLKEVFLTVKSSLLYKESWPAIYQTIKVCVKRKGYSFWKLALKAFGSFSW